MEGLQLFWRDNMPLESTSNSNVLSLRLPSPLELYVRKCNKY